MDRRKKIILVAVSLLAGVLLIIILIALFQGNRKTAEQVPAADLRSHPIYSKYEYGAGDNIIDFGCQPLGVPIGVISDVMRHDMILQDVLAGLGMKLRFHAFLKGSDVNYFLERGDLEIAMGGDMPAIMAACAHDTVILSLTKQGFSTIIARNHMMLEELRGKRIGYPFGSNAHYALLQAITSVGLKEEDVELISLDVTEMAEKLAAREIDAFIAWEPFSSMALQQYDNFMPIHRYLSSSYLYMSQSFVKQYPDAARHIIAAQIRAMTWMTRRKNNLLKAAQWNLKGRGDLTGQEQSISAQQIVALTRDGILGITPAPIIPSYDFSENGPLQREFDFLKKLGKIPSPISWSKVRDSFDRTTVKEVLSDPKRYRLYEFNYTDQEASNH